MPPPIDVLASAAAVAPALATSPAAVPLAVCADPNSQALSSITADGDGKGSKRGDGGCNGGSNVLKHRPNCLVEWTFFRWLNLDKIAKCGPVEIYRRYRVSNDEVATPFRLYLEYVREVLQKRDRAACRKGAVGLVVTVFVDRKFPI